MFKFIKRNKKENTEDILMKAKPDRRALSKVPDKDGVRTNQDRRRISLEKNSKTFEAMIEQETAGRRYLVNYNALVNCRCNGKKISCSGRITDISSTGVFLELPADFTEHIDAVEDWQLKFAIAPGSMPEGYEMQVNIKADCIRTEQHADKLCCGLEFKETLAQYATRKRGWYLLTIASMAFFIICLCILLLRTESVIYFKFNKTLYTYSIIAAVFLLTRYWFSMLYRPVPIDKSFVPGVTVVIPCFNEEEWIQRTVLSCLNQDYPLDKLEVIVVDDCSNDASFERIQELEADLVEREKLYC